MKQSKLHILFILALAFQFAFGQKYNFKNYSTKEGLANSNVNAIVQTREGYLWMCTQGGGLSRFNGKEFKNFTKADGLINNDVLSLCQDRDNNLWIGTTSGICRYDGSTFKSFSEKDGSVLKECYSIMCDSRGNLWFATFDGLLVYSSGKFKKFTTQTGLPTNEIICVFEDSQQKIWVGYRQSGLSNIDINGKVSNHIPSFSYDDKKHTAFTFTQDKTGRIWVGEAGSGIYKMNLGKIVRVDIPEVNNDFIGTIICDKNGLLWAATDHGLLKINGLQHTLFSEKQGLASDRVQAVMQDYEGKIWIGTLGGGVSMFTNEAVVTYNSNTGLTNDKIYSILETSKGLVLVGYFNGLDIGINGVFTKLKGVPGLDEETITSIFEDSHHNVWVGTEAKGIFVFSQTPVGLSLITKIGNASPLLIENPLKFVESNGIIYGVCYGQGVYAFENYKPRLLEIDPKLPADKPISICKNIDGNIWVAFNGSGIGQINNDKVIPVTDKYPESLNNVWCLLNDEKGHLFFGTQDGGLVVHDKTNYKSYTTKDGLCSNYIISLAYDRGALWIGTEKGVDKIIFDDNGNIKKVTYFGTDDGFKSIELNQNTIFANSNSKVWFGTLNGLTRYDSKYDVESKIEPKLILQNIKLFYQDVNWANFSKKINSRTNLPEELSLSYKNNHLTFNFQAATTDHVVYQFMMVGLDDNWSPADDKNEAVYTNIPPGNYTFKVKAINPKGISSEEISFSFDITPPFWRTWWFYTLVILTLTIGIVSYFRYRTAALEKEKRILEEKVEERTIALQESNHKLSDALHDIKDSINYAERIQRAMLPALENMQNHLPQSFIYFQPRDVVSGDFYWYSHKDGVDYFATCDCTGHGVPGAFMSMVGNSLLNEIILTKNITSPSVILSELNKGVQSALKQRENQTRDGMDVAFVAIDYPNKKVTYAGANRALWIVKNSEMANDVFEIKATKSAIGGFTDESQVYEQHVLELKTDDVLYMHTDGYADQFGGPNGKKLMTKKFKEIVLSMQQKNMRMQGVVLENEIVDWMKKTYEQVDDILVVGIKF